jgi:hypothetical protein
MVEFGVILIAVLLAALMAFLLYRASRSFDAGAHVTYLTTKGGDFYGALRAPITLWDPSVKVLRERNAPDITIMTCDASGQNYFEKTLVNRRTGAISLRVHTCAPRPFVTRTSDKRQLLIKPKVSFQLDIERIQIPAQLDAFGATLGARIENLFDNAIGAMEDQDVFARQREIEQGVLQQLIEMETAVEGQQTVAMPLGIKIFEAMFSYEQPNKAINKEGRNGGPMGYDHEHLDDLVDMLEKADPRTTETLLRMMEMQTKQNIVDMLCKSGGLVAFTASELGLSERTVDRASNGANIMKPAAYPTASNGAGEAAPATSPVSAGPAMSPAEAYYALGAPKGKQPPPASSN